MGSTEVRQFPAAGNVWQSAKPAPHSAAGVRLHRAEDGECGEGNRPRSTPNTRTKGRRCVLSPWPRGLPFFAPSREVLFTRRPPALPALASSSGRRTRKLREGHEVELVVAQNPDDLGGVARVDVVVVGVGDFGAGDVAMARAAADVAFERLEAMVGHPVLLLPWRAGPRGADRGAPRTPAGKPEEGRGQNLSLPAMTSPAKPHTTGPGLPSRQILSSSQEPWVF